MPWYGREVAEEVGKIVTWANEKNIPVVPVSSKVHFYGCSIPKQGGIVVDLSRMDKILEIDHGKPSGEV